MLKSSIFRLRILGLMEGSSLLLLIGVAVPLKHLLGQPAYVSILGPIHGAIFLIYLLNVWETATKERWLKGETVRTILVAFIPFGTFYNDGFLRRKQETFGKREER